MFDFHNIFSFDIGMEQYIRRQCRLGVWRVNVKSMTMEND